MASKIATRVVIVADYKTCHTNSSYLPNSVVYAPYPVPVFKDNEYNSFLMSAFPVQYKP